MTPVSPANAAPLASLDADYALLKHAVKDAGALALGSFRKEIAVQRKADGSAPTPRTKVPRPTSPVRIPRRAASA